VPQKFTAPLEFAGKDRPLRVATAICFESCFMRPTSELKKQGAGVLFVLTNDEWFTGTNAPWEHAAMSALRAAENGITVAQSANGGYSFVIDGRGRFLTISEFGRVQTLEEEVPLAQ
jgi:apolipoprotein N-acyltransferase